MKCARTIFRASVGEAWARVDKTSCKISGPPVEVGVTMYVLSISSLSEVKMVQKHTQMQP